MPQTGFFSPAQLVGYIAFIIGVYSFLQKDDRRLRATIGVQSLSYTVHFLLLGSPAASAAAFGSSVRTFTSLRTRSTQIGVAFLAMNVALGFVVAEGPVGWLPIVGSCIGTIAFFWFEGLAMRLVLLSSTACWFANNALLGSIGGTSLELLLGAVNASTCYRMWRAERAECIEPIEQVSTPNA
jgi:hypothetical protein